MNARAALKASSVPRRGLSRLEAATYVGVGATLFDVMVCEGKMPQPIRIAGRVIWDMREIDLAFEQLRGMNMRQHDKNEWEES